MGALKSRRMTDSSILAVKQLVAGGCAGAVTKTTVAPLERIKIIFQVQGMKLKPGEAPKYTGILQTGMKVVREEGFLSLYRSNGVNCLRIIPVYALKFGLNDQFKLMVKRDDQDIAKGLDTSQLIACGAMAGFIQNLCTYPMDLIKTRLALAKDMGIRYEGIRHCFTHTMKTEGVLGVYKGWMLATSVVMPYVAIQMSVYDILQRKLKEHKVAEHLTGHDDGLLKAALQKTLSGGAAGLATQLATYPGNTMIKRNQSNGMGGREKEYSSSFDMIRKIFAKEGWKGFYKGVGVNVIKGIPNASIQFIAYDSMKHLLGM